MTTRRFTISLALALMVLVTCSKPNSVQYAGDIPLTIANDKGENVCSVHMAPSTDDSWGDSWLNEGEVIAPGGERRFGMLPHPEWAVQVVMCSGHVHETVVGVSSAIKLAVTEIPQMTTVLLLVNDGFDNVCQLRMVPSSADSWGGDWIGDGYHLPMGNEQSFIVRRVDDFALQLSMCTGDVREHRVATLEPVVVAVSQTTKVTSIMTLVNDLGADVCVIQMTQPGDLWGGNWLDYGTYVPAGNTWTAHVRMLQEIAVQVSDCGGYIYEGYGYSSLQDTTIYLSWLQLTYAPPEQVVLEQDGNQGGYEQGGDQGGYDQGGYDQGGNDQGGYDQGGDQGGYGGCDPSEPPRCDGDAVLTCADVGGVMAEQRQVCPLGCENAHCVYAYELCQPHFAGSGTCPSVCDYSNAVIVDGNHYCTCTCGPNRECPSGTACTNDGMCLPPCQTASDCPEGFLPICGDSGFCGRI